MKMFNIKYALCNIEQQMSNVKCQIPRYFKINLDLVSTKFQLVNMNDKCIP